MAGTHKPVKRSKKSNRGKLKPSLANTSESAKSKLSEKQPTKLKIGKYRHLRRRYPTRTYRLPSAWRLTANATKLLMRHKQLFGGILLIYVLLEVILVQSLSVINLKNQAQTGGANTLTSSFSALSKLLSSSGSNSSASGGVYQTVLILIASLAIIWALRQITAGGRVRIRDSFYRGMYPLIPFVLLLLLIGLELIPLLIGSTIYAMVMTQGIAVLLAEKVLWAVIFLGLALISLYLICSSLIALYIVTLPDMTPVKALRSARELVGGRRLTVLRKIIYLPLFLLFVCLVIMLPLIIWLAPIAQWLFLVVAAICLAFFHSYMYGLYRELLHD